MRPVQSTWGWKIAAYLFLAGAGAGSYIAGVFADFRGEESLARVGVAMGVPLVILGTLFLLWDLGKQTRFYRAFLGSASSWITRGTWILSGFVVLGGITIALWLWPFTTLVGQPGLRHTLEVIAAVFAFAAAIYTGILIGVPAARPFWNTPLLPILFLVSALSTGAGVVFLVYALWRALSGTAQAVPGDLLETLSRLDIALIVAESLIVYVYLAIVQKRSPESVRALVRGPLSLLFWAGFATLGLLLPALLELGALASQSEGVRLTLMALAGVALLSGGLCLRLAILEAGIRAPIRFRVPFFVRMGT